MEAATSPSYSTFSRVVRVQRGLYKALIPVTHGARLRLQQPPADPLTLTRGCRDRRRERRSKGPAVASPNNVDARASVAIRNIATILTEIGGLGPYQVLGDEEISDGNGIWRS